MTDKELLEMAARAAGIVGVDGVYPIFRGASQDWNSEHWTEWNPLTDDGDALRLAVQLGMQITIILDGADGDHFPQTMVDWATEEHINDPCAATRRAIVRVAAEIGKAMP
jgi:hypothetical protein